MHDASVSDATRFLAYRLFDVPERPQGRVVEMTIAELPPGEVLIRTAYAGVNYKDALAAHGMNKLIREYPRIGGIDMTGTVVSSSDRRFAAGDEVIVHGFGIGIDTDGGFSQYARMTADRVMKLPAGLSLEAAASIGVAGYTAALSIDLLEHNGLTPAAGEVIVSGATGNVGCVAIDMLSAAGYRVVALTGKPDAAEFLSSIGASEILPRESVRAKRPLESARWAGALDAVGGEVLDGIIRAMKPNGVVAAYGNAGSMDLPTSVLPFILRGVRLIGVNANSPMPVRERVWPRAAAEFAPRHFDRMVRRIPLSELGDALVRALAGGSFGRTIVDVWGTNPS
ncbi:MAG: acryloyl-CoA reductase [Burkholderiaceae bacterium]